MTSRRAALAEMEAWCFGAQLEFRSWCETASQRAIELLRGRLHEAERKRLEQLKVYQEARQQREVFESLRESQREVYERELARRQQQAADEAFLMRTLEAPRD
jgi:flagellar biosynthesis chaperone FliJ